MRVQYAVTRLSQNNVTHVKRMTFMMPRDEVNTLSAEAVFTRGTRKSQTHIGPRPGRRINSEVNHVHEQVHVDRLDTCAQTCPGIDPWRVFNNFYANISIFLCEIIINNNNILHYMLQYMSSLKHDKTWFSAVTKAKTINKILFIWSLYSFDFCLSRMGLKRNWANCDPGLSSIWLDVISSFCIVTAQIVFKYSIISLRLFILSRAECLKTTFFFLQQQLYTGWKLNFQLQCFFRACSSKRMNSGG